MWESREPGGCLGEGRMEEEARSGQTAGLDAVGMRTRSVVGACAKK